ncbi:MAG TPA: glycosyltransferase family 39 protein [Vicinamibacterales bacterium]
MKAAAATTARTTVLSLSFVDQFAVSRVAATASFIVAVMALAFGLRAAALSTYGFSEDEINKVRAIEQYRHGALSANAEHPMLMKLAMLTSVDATRGLGVPIETAVRLPNAVVGAATTGVLFAAAQLLFGTPVAVMAALFWAFDVNAIAINRIGKEDTFALFFFLLAVWCYERAKRQGASDPAGAQRWYGGSGVSFGLMLASKYFPWYLGVYALFNVLADRNPGANRPDKVRYYGAMVTAFLLANVAVLEPATWHYVTGYVQGATLVHHGYPFAGRLYANSSVLSSGGIPATFYLRMLATKVPLVVLGAIVPGVVETIRRRRERGFVLLSMWLALFLVGYSIASVKFLRYALPLFAASDLLAAIGVVAGAQWLLRKSWLSPLTRVTVAAVALTAFVFEPFLAQHAAAPFFSTSRNALGERLAPAGTTFPEEMYDFGVREAAAAIAEAAEPDAVVVSDAPGVVAYYLEHSGRTDLRVRSLSGEGMPRGDTVAFVIVLPEHLTFENQDLVAQLTHTTPWQEYYAGDALAAQVFRVHRS